MLVSYVHVDQPSLRIPFNNLVPGLVTQNHSECAVNRSGETAPHHGVEWVEEEW